MCGPQVEIVTDATRVRQIRNGIAEGELILRTGKFHDKARSAEYLAAVRKSVDNAYRKLGETPRAIAEPKRKATTRKKDATA